MLLTKFFDVLDIFNYNCTSRLTYLFSILTRRLWTVKVTERVINTQRSDESSNRLKAG